MRRGQQGREGAMVLIGLLAMASDSSNISLSIKAPKETFTVTIASTANALQLKEMIKEHIHTPVDEQKLVWKGWDLADI